MFVLLHSTRHNEAMTSDDVIHVMVNVVYYAGEYISPQLEQIDQQVTIMFIRDCFVAALIRLLDTFAWPF